MSEFDIGFIQPTTAKTLGPCWMYCNGRLLSEDEQPELHAVLGDAYNRREFEPLPPPTILQRLRLRARPKRRLVMVDPPGFFRIPNLIGREHAHRHEIRYFIYVGGEQA